MVNVAFRSEKSRFCANGVSEWRYITVTSSSEIPDFAPVCGGAVDFVGNFFAEVFFEESGDCRDRVMLSAS